MGNLFQELKRRKVFKVSAVYAVVAWDNTAAWTYHLYFLYTNQYFALFID